MPQKRILVIAPNLRISNGVTSFIMGNYNNLVKHGFNIDFLLVEKVDSPFNQIVEDNGSHIFVYPKSTKKYSRENYVFAKQIFETSNYDMIHCNLTGIFAYWVLLAAQKCNVSHRIYHSHNPKENTSLKAIIRGEIFDRLCFFRTTHFMACTEYAGKSVFGKRKFIVVNNGIDFSRFEFNQKKRNEIRLKYEINQEILIGTVCRQAEQKNPFFIIDVLNELLKIKENYRLMWIGSGLLLDKVKDYATSLGIRDRIMFLGDRVDVNYCYSAMDCFFLPSKYEGLGIVFLEAQASGLYCFASTEVPKDTDITGNISYISLDNGAVEWAWQMNSKLMGDSFDRTAIVRKIEECDVNICNTNKMLIEAYETISKVNEENYL